jgi:hypothetical protein
MQPTRNFSQGSKKMPSPKELIDQFLEEYPNGTEVEIDDNICECASWTVGENRCSCGARRIYLDVIDDMVFPMAD